MMYVDREMRLSMVIKLIVRKEDLFKCGIYNRHHVVLPLTKVIYKVIGEIDLF